MATYFTTAALVKLRVKNVSSTLTDANIEEYINNAEDIIIGLMKSNDYDFKTNFDSTKHGLLRDAANNLAAFYVVLYERNTALTTSEWSKTLEILWKRWTENRQMLEDQDVVKSLRGL